MTSGVSGFDWVSRTGISEVAVLCMPPGAATFQLATEPTFERLGEAGERVIVQNILRAS